MKLTKNPQPTSYGVTNLVSKLSPTLPTNFQFILYVPSLGFHINIQLILYQTQTMEADSANEYNILFYELVQKEHVFETLSKSNNLKVFCHAGIMNMWEIDKEKNNELITCLKTYLLNGRNLAETARKLYLHRNTLIYRLEKISSLINVNLNAATEDELFFCLISCLIIEYAVDNSIPI